MTNGLHWLQLKKKDPHACGVLTGPTAFSYEAYSETYEQGR